MTERWGMLRRTYRLEMCMKPTILLALLLVFGHAHAAKPAELTPQTIDSSVREVMMHFRLPGIAVGVIDNGQVVYARGYGETVVGSGDPVTGDTLFKIASNSKAMTAALLARLVQQGKLRWDDPVVKYLPNFAMHDPWVTQHMTVNDLLIHTSGLPEGGGDLMLWPEPNHFTRDDIVQGLRYIKPAYGFRAGYAYDNLLYVVAGQVAAAAGGASYETLMQREVFQPLGLTGCRVGAFALKDAGSVAQPHGRDGDTIVRTRGDAAVVPVVASAPAGGIRCTLNAMLAWTRNWLTPDAAQLHWLGKTQREEIWKARTPMPVSKHKRKWDNTHYYAYAYGFRLADMDGQWTVSHTGTLGGMYSMMMLLPDRRAGFVILINGDGGDARTVLGEVLLKLFTAPQTSLGVQGYADALAAAEAASSASNPPALPDIRLRVPVTAAELRPWLGRWRDPWFGEVTICAVQAGVGVEWRSLKSPKMHGRIGRLNGRIVLAWEDEAVDEDAWLNFSGRGNTRRLRMAKLNARGDFSSDYEDLDFQRIGDCKAH